MMNIVGSTPDIRDKMNDICDKCGKWKGPFHVCAKKGHPITLSQARELALAQTHSALPTLGELWRLEQARKAISAGVAKSDASTTMRS